MSNRTKSGEFHAKAKNGKQYAIEWVSKTDRDGNRIARLTLNKRGCNDATVLLKRTSARRLIELNPETMQQVGEPVPTIIDGAVRLAERYRLTLMRAMLYSGSTDTDGSWWGLIRIQPATTVTLGDRTRKAEYVVSHGDDIHLSNWWGDIKSDPVDSIDLKNYVKC